ASLAAACTSTEPDPVASAEAAVTAAEQQVKDAQAALTSAEAAFCNQAKDYVRAIDRYGKLFSDSAATVGDVQELGADLESPKAATVTAAQGVVDARDQLTAANRQLVEAHDHLVAVQSSVAASPSASPFPSPSPVATAPGPSSLPEASIAVVKQAE